MQNYTGKQMLKIDIANTFGKDKEIWEDRLTWFDFHEHELEALAVAANEPMLYTKAVKAYRDTQLGIPVGHNMFLDATASGLQILAALSGCKETAKKVNMLFNGKRNDVYTELADEMNKVLDSAYHVVREDIKKPLMTHFYNKMNQSAALNPRQEIAFYHALGTGFAGAQAVMNMINLYWNPNALYHKWTLPDKHVAYVPVTEMKTARIEVDELKGITFSYRFEANQSSDRSSSLVPNIVHSIDAYIVREMIKRSYAAGFELAHIFDAFCAHPNHMGKVAQFYREIMAEIADSNLLCDILNEISGTTTTKIQKFSNDLSKDILASEYMLS